MNNKNEFSFCLKGGRVYRRTRYASWMHIARRD